MILVFYIVIVHYPLGECHYLPVLSHFLAVASEHCSSFKDSSSIACNSSVISCMSVAVCLALSLKLLCNFTIGLAVVTVFAANLAMFFFPLLKNFIAFPLS